MRSRRRWLRRAEADREREAERRGGRRLAAGRPGTRRGLRGAGLAADSAGQTLVRAGFRVLLEDTEDLEVVGEAANGAQAVDLARSTRPNVVLMDVRMPVMDGLEANCRIVGDPLLAGVRVVALTTWELDGYVFEALRAGASGFLLKDIEPADLRQAVRVVAAGEALLSPSVTRRLISAFVAQPGWRPANAGRLAVLTDREREVVALVAEGLSNQAVPQSVNHPRVRLPRPRRPHPYRAGPLRPPRGQRVQPARGGHALHRAAGVHHAEGIALRYGLLDGGDAEQLRTLLAKRGLPVARGGVLGWVHDQPASWAAGPGVPVGRLGDPPPGPALAGGAELGY